MCTYIYIYIYIYIYTYTQHTHICRHRPQGRQAGEPGVRGRGEVRISFPNTNYTFIHLITLVQFLFRIDDSYLSYSFFTVCSYYYLFNVFKR